MTRRIAAGAATAAVLLGGATAPAAHAQSTDRGSTTVVLGSSALEALKQQGVTVTAVKPAKLSAGKLRLPVARGILGARSSSLEHDGGLTFRRKAGGKTLKVSFTELRATLGSQSTISATSAGARVSLFTVAKRTATVNATAGTADLAATKVTLTTKAATLIRKRLKLRKAPSRALGTVAVEAALRGKQAGGTTGGGTTTPTTGTTTPPPANAPCGSVTNRPITRPEPTLLSRPGTAQTVTARVTWHVRESFITYLASGGGPSDGTVVSDGAAELALTKGDKGDKALLVYEFEYQTPADSWFDAASGTGVFRAGGKLNFSYPSHCINYDAMAPEIEITPSGSRAVFTMAGRDGTPIAQRRYTLATLDNVPPAVSGNTVTYAKMNAKVAEGAGDEVFGGFYANGDDLGWVTVTYTY